MKKISKKEKELPKLKKLIRKNKALMNDVSLEDKLRNHLALCYLHAQLNPGTECHIAWFVKEDK